MIQVRLDVPSEKGTVVVGMIPRLTNALFAKVGHADPKYPQTHVWVSYLEIYNEKLRDLLAAGDDDGNGEEACSGIGNDCLFYRRGPVCVRQGGTGRNNIGGS